MGLLGNARSILRGDPNDLDNVEEIDFALYTVEMASKHGIERQSDVTGLFGIAQKGNDFPEERLSQGMEQLAEQNADFDAAGTLAKYKQCFIEMEADIKVSKEIADARKEQKKAAAAAKKLEAEKKKQEREEQKKKEAEEVKKATAILEKEGNNALVAASKQGGFLADTSSFLPAGFELNLETGQTVIPADASREDLLQAITYTAALKQRVGQVTEGMYWMIGDSICRYRNQYGGAWQAAIEGTGIDTTLDMSMNTLRKVASVCERFSLEERIPGLPFTHYVEAYVQMPKDPEKSAELKEKIAGILKKAAAGKEVAPGVRRPLPAQAFVRQKVKEAKADVEGEPLPQPEKIEAEVITVEVDSETGVPSVNVQYSSKPLEPNQVTALLRAGAVIISRKNRKQITNMNGTSDIKWIDKIDTSEVDAEIAAAKAEEEAKKAEAEKAKKAAENAKNVTPAEA